MKRLWQWAPGLLALCVLFVGVGEALAFKNPEVCRPEVRYDKATGKYLLYNPACINMICPGSDPQVDCISYTDGNGWKGCLCPGADHTCVLIYKVTGEPPIEADPMPNPPPPGPPPGYVTPVKKPVCKKLNCTGPCTLTSGGGSSPWVVYCAQCSD